MKPTQFCPEGHDTHVVGRVKGYCRQCQRDDERAWRSTARGRWLSSQRQARYEGTVKGILTALRRHARGATPA